MWLSYNVDSTLVKTVLIPNTLQTSVCPGKLTVTLKPGHEPVNIRFLTKSDEIKELRKLDKIIFTILCRIGLDSIVPFTMKVHQRNINRFKLLIRDFSTFFICAVINFCSNF